MPEQPAAAQQIEGLLFEPFKIGSLTLKNRVMIAPMGTYSAVDGFSNDFHLVHLGRFALGGAGLVMTEATAVAPEGRISAGCCGLWLDEHVAPLRRLVDFLHRYDSAAAIQLAHSGRKGSSQRPWHDGGPLGEEDARLRGEPGWGVVGPSPIPFDVGWPRPHELSEVELDSVVEDYRRATLRACEAGFDLIELHYAHGYLMHSFLSPLSNRRDDQYGGSLENRMRFPLRAVEAVRAAWPAGRPLAVRISVVDGIDVGWSIEESIVFSRELAARGVDIVDCSSGGMKLPHGRLLLWREPGFHVPYAARIRREAGVPTIAVGLIREAAHADSILREGSADLIAIGREALYNPNWVAQAAVETFGNAGWSRWPDEFGWWLEYRARPRRAAVS